MTFGLQRALNFSVNSIIFAGSFSVKLSVHGNDSNSGYSDASFITSFITFAPGFYNQILQKFASSASFFP
jgi:hypothetical protein